MTETRTIVPPPARSANGVRASEARLKRLFLFGTLATFVGFLGLTVVSDAVADVAVGGDAGVVIVQYQDGQPVVAQAHVRTKSS